MRGLRRVVVREAQGAGGCDVGFVEVRWEVDEGEDGEELGAGVGLCGGGGHRGYGRAERRDMGKLIAD